MQIELQVAHAHDLSDTSTELFDAINAHGPGCAEAVAQVLATVTATSRPEPWGAYWGFAEGRPVGLCAFKAAPDSVSATEIAYFTFPPLEGRGAATAMATALIEVARDAGACRVLANTLPIECASTRILGNIGFLLTGPAEDPEDGPVWAWRLDL